MLNLVALREGTFHADMNGTTTCFFQLNELIEPDH